jgi:hypothetical protein
MGSNMKNDSTLFWIKRIDFEEEGQRDPFGFDNFAEKLADKYLPFSGTVRKPIYLLFVQYFNWLWEERKIPVKKKREAQIRFEKLLVCAWRKKEKGRKNLRGASVLGNSKYQINPFTAKDWITQTCFDIYGGSVKAIITKENFVKKFENTNKREAEILNDFWAIENPILNKRNERRLNDILTSLGKIKKSLFNGDHRLILDYKKLFKDKLKSAIGKNVKDDTYFRRIEPYLDNPSKLKNSERFKKEILENDKFLFKSLNNWFKTFIKAVDKEISKGDAKNEWDEANKLYERIKWNEMPKGIKPLNKQPLSEKVSWVNKENGHYKKITKGNNKFDEDGWNALVRRTGRKHFFDFRHTALISLLRELT